MLRDNRLPVTPEPGKWPSALLFGNRCCAEVDGSVRGKSKLHGQLTAHVTRRVSQRWNSFRVADDTGGIARWLENAKVRAARNTVPRAVGTSGRRTMKLPRLEFSSVRPVRRHSRGLCVNREAILVDLQRGNLRF